ncbi:hypothetical protein B0H15DRAFT_857285 [Mycena belliarum]|uniref:Uncharacterized protein n=1 Tax=Mycena belliarum TaxID=1033014 RepID=A0AAD6XQ85_9AGAR|nr:hypothetical protein B0H15DRAFT_857285 [Mycena belliae]
MSPPPQLRIEKRRDVYLNPHSIQLNAPVTFFYLHRLPRGLRPHLSLVLCDSTAEIFKVELYVDDDQKHRVAFGRYPASTLDAGAERVGSTTWSYVSVIDRAIEITHRGPAYLGGSHMWANDYQAFAEELCHVITTTPVFNASPELPTHGIRADIGDLDVHLASSSYVNANPHWANKDWTVGTNGVALLTGPAGPGRSAHASVRHFVSRIPASSLITSHVIA